MLHFINFSYNFLKSYRTFNRSAQATKIICNLSAYRDVVESSLVSLRTYSRGLIPGLRGDRQTESVGSGCRAILAPHAAPGHGDRSCGGCLGRIIAT
jgi:hypothetical protein